MNTADVWDGLGWLFGNHEEGQFAYTDTSGSLEDPVLDSVWLGEEGSPGEEGTTIATTEFATTYEEDDQLVSASETFFNLEEHQPPLNNSHNNSNSDNNDDDNAYWQDSPRVTQHGNRTEMRTSKGETHISNSHEDTTKAHLDMERILYSHGYRDIFLEVLDKINGLKSSRKKSKRFMQEALRTVRRLVKRQTDKLKPILGPGEMDMDPREWIDELSWESLDPGEYEDEDSSSLSMPSSSQLYHPPLSRRDSTYSSANSSITSSTRASMASLSLHPRPLSRSDLPTNYDFDSPGSRNPTSIWNYHHTTTNRDTLDDPWTTKRSPSKNLHLSDNQETISAPFAIHSSIAASLEGAKKHKKSPSFIERAVKRFQSKKTTLISS
jgi:hypothetical protein